VFQKLVIKSSIIRTSTKKCDYSKNKRERKDKKDNHFNAHSRINEIRIKIENYQHTYECFDNSNFQGTNAVSACVVFKNAKPSKKDYRHFNVKTVVGANDFDTMKEIVYQKIQTNY
jgi:excinuclease ABC subunit C